MVFNFLEIFILMAKLKITEQQYTRLQSKLVEEIHPSEAYKDADGVKTVIDGRRDVGFISDAYGYNDTLIQNIKDAGLMLIPMKQSHHAATAYVFYRKGAEENAQKLASIARKHGGYLPIETPEETYVIGRLLGYEKDAVEEFVLEKFPHFKFYHEKA
jgi:hypothetical protein